MEMSREMTLLKCPLLGGKQEATYHTHTGRKWLVPGFGEERHLVDPFSKVPDSTYSRFLQPEARYKGMYQQQQ
jgi:hypothetical protein